MSVENISILGLWAAYLQAIPSRITNRIVTGIAIPRISGIRHAFWAGSFYLLGIAGAWVAVEGHAWLGLPVCWALAIHGSRKLQVNIGHACSHRTVTGNVKIDQIMGIASHLVVVATEFETYEETHVRIHHNWEIVATQHDNTFRALQYADIEAGVPKLRLYRNLLLACFSPIYHARVLEERLKSHLTAGSRPRLLFIAFWASVLAAVTATGTWVTFLAAVVFPLVWGYQTSQLLRLCVEHRLPVDPKGRPRPSEEMQDLTDGIVLRLNSPIDMVVRALVLTGDTVSHDYHHYNPKSTEWANYTTSRAIAKAQAVAKGRRSQYHEFVGFRAVLDACFDAMSRAPRGGK